MVVTQAVPPADLPADPQVRLNAMLDRQVAQLAGFREIEHRVDAQRDHALAGLRVDWHDAQARRWAVWWVAWPAAIWAAGRPAPVPRP